MIAVSTVSLLLIVSLTIALVIQCVLIIRMRSFGTKSSKNESDQIYDEIPAVTKATDVHVSLNDAYAMASLRKNSNSSI